MSRVHKLTKMSLFGLVALHVLVVGGFAAQLAWHIHHHRYAQPDSGIYYGSVSGNLSHIGEFESDWYFLNFKGRSLPRWYWSRPTNFVYKKLQLDWQRETTKGTADLYLPSFDYETSAGKGKLTLEVLRQWLPWGEGSESNPVNDLRLEAILGHLKAAGDGELPRPNHHGYSLDEPLHGSLKHFQLGIGFGWTVYLWIIIWLALVIHCWRRLFKAKPDADMVPPSFPP